MTDLLGSVRGATFSDDRRFRYKLWVTWDASRPVANLLMLNPSTADEESNDPTIARQIVRVDRLGYGGLIVTNAYAFKATDPKELKAAGFPVGEFNDQHIADAAKVSQIVICGWGTHIQKTRANAILKLLRVKAKRAPHALSFTNGGQPGHPLYLPYEGCPPMEITNPNFCMECGFSIAPECGTSLCGECACEDDGL